MSSALQVFALAGYVTQCAISFFVKNLQYMLFSVDKLENLRKLVTAIEMGIVGSILKLPSGV